MTQGNLLQFSPTNFIEHLCVYVLLVIEDTNMNETLVG